jgi:tuftelin-interacting protein 11
MKGVQTVSSGSFITKFKDLIEKNASENNIQFLPIPNRFKEGKQIYRFGNLNVYIEGTVIYVSQNGLWSPTSINEIIQKAV